MFVEDWGSTVAAGAHAFRCTNGSGQMMMNCGLVNLEEIGEGLVAHTALQMLVCPALCQLHLLALRTSALKVRCLDTFFKELPQVGVFRECELIQSVWWVQDWKAHILKHENQSEVNGK